MTRPNFGYIAAGGGAADVSKAYVDAGDAAVAFTANQAYDLAAAGRYSTETKTASFTAAASKVYLVDTTAGAVTATLPAANVAGQQVVLKWVAGSNAANVARSGTDTIGSATTSATVPLLDEIWEFTSSGSGQWNLTGGNKTLASLDGRFSPNALTVGDETFSRELLTASNVGPASGQLRLTYFTARKTESSTQCRILTGGTAAAATPTLCRIGVYEIASNGDGTLVAATANDTTLFAAANTAYTRSWAVPFTKVAGRRYALAPLVVSAGTMPTFPGYTVVNALEAGTFAPVLGWAIGGFTDLPGSFLATAGFASGHRYYAALLP